jgi:hypothetical protein
MAKPENLQIDVRHVPDLATAIDNWLGARDKFRIDSSEECQREYNTTLYDLGAAWNERYSQEADTLRAFDWFRLGLIAPEEE